MTEFCIVLENINTGETFDLNFTVLENSTAKKWIDQLRDDLKNHETIKSIFRYFIIDKLVAIDLLNNNIDALNRLDENAKLPNISIDTLDQSMCNFLHDYFVKTHASVGYDDLLDEHKENNESLNKNIHRYEGLRRGLTPRIMCSCVGRPIFKLDDSDYDNFAYHGNLGDIFITYCMVGKSYIDVFRDNDEIVNDDEIRPQNVYSSDFVMRFSERPLGPVSERFTEWLINRGLDPADKKLALGKIKVASPTIPMDKTMIDIIKNHQKVKEIRII